MLNLCASEKKNRFIHFPGDVRKKVLFWKFQENPRKVSWVFQSSLHKYNVTCLRCLNVFVSFSENFFNCWESVYVGPTFVKCLWWNYFSNRKNDCILHLCQKFCHLHWYVTKSRSRTLELLKNSGVADSPLGGCRATKFELQTIFGRYFENVGILSMKTSAMEFLFSKLQAFKLKSLALCALTITEIPEIALLWRYFLQQQRSPSSLQIPSLYSCLEKPKKVYKYV